MAARARTLVAPGATFPELGLRVVRATQRGWSCHGIGTDDAGTEYFIKQFRRRDGRWLDENFGDEAAANEVARRHVRSLTIERVIARDEHNLILAFPAVAMDTPDEILRSGTARIDQVWPATCTAMGALVTDLLAAADAVPGLKIRKRDFGTAPALAMKGLDVRNIGFRIGSDVPTHLFDLGRAYVAPVEEVTAKLLVSVGLLNWGAPVTRFASGPPRELIDGARDALAPWLDPRAIRAEIDTQLRGRLANAIGSNAADRLARRLAVEGLGRLYAARLKRVSARRAAGAPPPGSSAGP